MTINDPSKHFPPDLLRPVIEVGSDAILITDTDLDDPGPRILYVNDAFERMTGYSLAEVDFLTGLSNRRRFDEIGHFMLETSNQ